MVRSINVTSGETMTGFSQPDGKLIAMQKRSYAFDEQLKNWKAGQGTTCFYLDRPSWILQMFGASTQRPLLANRQDFVHVLLNPDEFAFGKQGKHGLKPEELRGLLVGIQRPIAVFKSATAKPGGK